MKINHKMAMALVGLTAATTFNAQASYDDFGCGWQDDCPLNGVPWLNIDNDTRVNLIQLEGARKNLALPRLPVPPDFTRSRSYHFGFIGYNDLPHPTATPSTENTTPAPVAETSFSKMSQALGVDTSSWEHDQDAENRHISNNLQSVEQFFAALLDDPTIKPEDRHHLAVWRGNIFLNSYDKADSRLPVEAFDIEPGSHTAAFSDYLRGANVFYLGDFVEANSLFTALQKSSQPWVAETSSYMLMRVALNKSTVKATDEYGMFDATKIDTGAASEARDYANAYLATWPEGRYADSARGLLRRINWYLQDWQQLAPLYEKALAQAPDVDSLHKVISELDDKFQSRDSFGNYEPFISDAQAPMLTFTQTLRWLRNNQGQNKSYEVTRENLDSLKPIFASAELQPYWSFLENAWLYYHEGNYAAVIEATPSINLLASSDLLAFSQQVLHGDALAAQKQWPEALAHWKHLLGLTQSVEQQQYIQLNLAAVMVNNQQPEAIFAADSPVTNLRYRSLVLKTAAPKALLQQQATHGVNDEEKTIALHTLLMRDLMVGDYEGYDTDKSLRRHITKPVTLEAFNDVNLDIFNWNGERAEKGYFCASLDDTVKTLIARKTDAHALNCLGEFFRNTAAHIDTEAEGGGNDLLGDAIAKPALSNSPDRQAYYQQIINDPKAEPEDKTYALYRAVMCYSPSGYNDCGGEEVKPETRKHWFTVLKTKYKGNQWEKLLSYYW